MIVNDQKQSCEYCDGQDGIEARCVTVYRHRKGLHFIFEDVPARVCKACGHKYFTWETVAEMDRLMAAPETLTHTQPVPVVSLSPAS